MCRCRKAIHFPVEWSVLCEHHFQGWIPIWSGAGYGQKFIPAYLWRFDISLLHYYAQTIVLRLPNGSILRDCRQQYERKRRKVLASATSLVEIDLLRGGKPFAMKVLGQSSAKTSDYRIVISRSWQRPSADLYLFSVRQPIPSFLIPLRPGEQEPVLPLNRILHELYDQGGYDLAIEYTDPADPPLATEDALWAAQLLTQ